MKKNRQRHSASIDALTFSIFKEHAKKYDRNTSNLLDEVIHRFNELVFNEVYSLHGIDEPSITLEIRDGQVNVISKEDAA